MPRRKRLTRQRYYKIRRQYKDEYRDAAQCSKEHIEKISKYRGTKLIHYPVHKAAYDYVNNKFSNAQVLGIGAYICPNSYLQRLGYKGVGGFYNRITGNIVLPEDFSSMTGMDNNKRLWKSVKGKISQDEALVHELLHYVSDTLPRTFKSIEMEEEFAYKHSVGYLRQKGYTDIQIVEWNFLPYFMSLKSHMKVVRQVLCSHGYDWNDYTSLSSDKQKKLFKRFEKDIFKSVKTAAIKIGLDLISDDSISMNESDTGEDKPDVGKFGFMEF